MSLPKAVLGGNFDEWRIFEFQSEMRSPLFLMDDAGMVCQVILEAVDRNAKDFKLYISLSNNASKYDICFICHINDSYYVRVENDNHQSGKYKASHNVPAILSPRHVCQGRSYMSVKLTWFSQNHLLSYTPILPLALIEQFGWLLRGGEFSDVAIETEGGSLIPVHRNILAVHSPVFHNMLKSDMAESNIKISNFPPETVKQMVTFIYSGQLEDVTYESAVRLLKIAHQYELKYLKQFCARYLLTHLNSSNALELLLLTHTCGEKVVKRHILSFIARNRKEFSEPRVFNCMLGADQKLFVEIINTLV